jgi:hypothetical protein
MAVLIVVAVVAAANGPVRVGDPIIDFEEIFAGVDLAADDENDDGDEQDLLPPLPDSTDRSMAGAVLGTAITVAVFLAVVYGLWRIVQAVMSRRTPRTRRREPDVVSIETVRRAAEEEADQLAVIESGEASNAVVACWVRLERAAASVGTARDPAQTPTEFTVGLLTDYQADRTAVDALLSLYHRARFSSAPLPDRAAAEARSALEQISRTLTARPRETEDAP